MASICMLSLCPTRYTNNALRSLLQCQGGSCLRSNNRWRSRIVALEMQSYSVPFRLLGIWVAKEGPVSVYFNLLAKVRFAAHDR